MSSVPYARKEMSGERATNEGFAGGESLDVSTSRLTANRVLTWS
jgi:hypothetical protein